jgi:hypothetical protein
MMALFLAFTAPAAAQVPWESPILLAPNSPGGLGIFLVEPTRAGGLGVLGTWRRAAAPEGVGFRLGLFEDPGDDLALTAGLDVSGTLLDPSDEIPMGFMWFLGAGIGVGDEVLLSFPAGISVGADLETDGILFRPYVAPRVSLDVFSGPGDDLDLAAAVDIGLDLAFSPEWVIRVAASLGDRRALGVGISLPGVSWD